MKKRVTLEEGINLDVPGVALAAQATERAAWHKQNAETIAAEIETIPEPHQPEQPADWRWVTRRNDLIRRLREHEERARFLDFVQRHINRRRVYRVTLRDLSDLEIAPKAYF